MTMPSAGTVLIAVAMFGLVSTAYGHTEEILRTIPIGTTGTFTLSKLSGSISVTRTDGTDLVHRATKRLPEDQVVNDPDPALCRVEVEIQERGNRVEVETEYDGSVGRGPSISVDYEVTVPRDTQVAIESISGDVTIDGVEAESRIEVVSGTMRLTSLPQLVDAEAREFTTFCPSAINLNQPVRAGTDRTDPVMRAGRGGFLLPPRTWASRPTSRGPTQKLQHQSDAGTAAVPLPSLRVRSLGGSRRTCCIRSASTATIRVAASKSKTKTEHSAARRHSRRGHERWTPSFGQVFVTAKGESGVMIQATLG